MALTLLGSAACKKEIAPQAAPDAAPPQDPIVEVAVPATAVGEVTIADPETFIRGAAAAAGNTTIATSTYAALVASVEDDELKRLLSAIDAHAPLTVTLVAAGKKLQFVLAARATGATAAAAALAPKPGQPADAPSAALGTPVHAIGDGGVAALFGDAILMSDSRDALEQAGRYAAYRARKVVSGHQIVARFDSPKLAGLARGPNGRAWMQLLPKGITPGVIKQLVPVSMRFFDRLAELGSATIEGDAVGDRLNVHGNVSATGATAEWLTQHVKADRRAILSLPKGDFVGAVTLPSELGPLSLSIGEVALDAVGFDPTARGEASKQLAALGRTLGGEVGFATRTEAAGRRELVARIHVEDPTAAKAAASALVKTLAKTARATMKVEIVPYTKFGAVGERLDTKEPSANDKDSWYWALRDSTLYVGACIACFTDVFDAALDPARTGTLEHAAALKPKLDALPDAGVLAATVTKNGATVDVTTLAASAGGLTLQGSVPLAWLFAGVEQLGLFEGEEGGEDPDGLPPP